jgi:dTDP-L-rhamnose 4-epimerase
MVTAMRVVVTGGAGFIGSHVVEQLTATGHDVVVLDSLDPAAHTGPPTALCDGVEYRWTDVADISTWRDVLDGADAVCHQAAKVGLGVDFSDVCRYVHANDVGTAAALWAMHEVGFTGRIVLASSMVVYGEGAYRCRRHGSIRPGPRQRDDLERGRFEPRCPRCRDALDPGIVSEDAALDPRNVYAATKVHQEHLVSAFAREHDLPATILRYHNVYGPRMPRDTPYAGVASIFRSALAAGRAPQVFEDGRQRRDFVHVSDVARANVLALTVPTAYDGAINVASGHPVTVLEMAEAIAAARSRVRPQVVGRYRLGDVRHIVADPSRARAAIGFEAEVHPTTGFRRFADDPLRA